MAHVHPRPLLIFPCNGNAIEALDCLGETYRFVAFVDDAAEKQGTEPHGHPVLPRTALAEQPEAFVLAVPGSPTSFRSRKQVVESLQVIPQRFARVIHPTARISPLAVIGQNVLIMAGVVITSNAVVGDWSLVGSNVTIAGGTTIGRNCYIGSGSSIMNGVHVDNGALVGLGSNVIRGVAAGATVAGNPARQIH